MMLDMLNKNSERLWKQLLAFIEEGRVIPVIGPELLMLNIDGKTTHLYSYLAEQLANQLEISFEPEDTLNTVVCRYTSQGGDREDIYPETQSVMPSLTKEQLPEALLQLAEIQPLKLFVSTSFDPLLVQALNQVRYTDKEKKTQVLDFYPGADSDHDLPVAFKELDRATVFHLFGKMSTTPDYAVTEEDVLEFMHKLQSRTSRPVRLFDALINNYLMGIGCPMSDWLGRFFVRINKKDRLINNAGGKTDFLVCDQLQIETNFTKFLQNFSNRTKIFPMESVEFVNELHRRWIELHPTPCQEYDPPPPQQEQEREQPELEETLPGSMPSGSVFLSYASEDRPAVMLIKQALEQAKVDVWFDRNPKALLPGDDFESIIKSNIDNCSLFIPIISRNTLPLKPGGRFFRIEWVHAQKVSERYPENWRYIIPVVIDDTPPDAPEIPKKFRDLHGVKLQDGQPPVEFVNEIIRLYREYQRSLAQPT